VRRRPLQQRAPGRIGAVRRAFVEPPARPRLHRDGREAAYYHALAAKYRDLAAAKDRGEFGTSPQSKSLRMTVEAGRRVVESLGDWADWAKQMPLPGPSDPPQGTAR
jgi:hypothetical protein